MKYVDLFSGCGGLSLGIERAGGELIAAVEKSDMAARTFFHNYVEDATDMARWLERAAEPLRVQLESQVLVSELSRVLGDDDVMGRIRSSGLDLVVGGPPCQGFSLAGRRNKDDTRNRLAWEYLDFVAATDPKAVVIENVVGMSRRFEMEEESSFSQLKRALSSTGRGYEVQAVLVNAMHYGAPQHRPRLMLIALRADLAEKFGVRDSGAVWKSTFSDEMVDRPQLAPLPIVSREQVFTVGDAVADLMEPSALDKEQSKNREYVAKLNASGALLRTASENARSGGPKNHVLRRHSERVRGRFALYHLLAKHGIDGKILNLLGGLPYETALITAKSAFAELKLEYPLDLPGYMQDGSPKSIDDLDDLCVMAVGMATKKHSQKVLKWNEPARTVVTLPDDYVHPKLPRIFTVRELARFQGFPDYFEFLGMETTGSHRRRVEVPQYTQVGNAVSPWQSYAVGRVLAEFLS